MILGYDRENAECRKSNWRLANEATVDLLGHRNPTMSTTTSASNASAAAFTLTSTATTTASADLGKLANVDAGVCA
jgi:hypothetical protein